MDRAKDEYAGKTIMICWEHKNMCVSLVLLSCCETHLLYFWALTEPCCVCSPYIVARFGLTDKQLDWGLDPYSEVSLPCSHAPDAQRPPNSHLCVVSATG